MPPSPSLSVCSCCRFLFCSRECGFQHLRPCPRSTSPQFFQEITINLPWHVSSSMLDNTTALKLPIILDDPSLPLFPARYHQHKLVPFNVFPCQSDSRSRSTQPSQMSSFLSCLLRLRFKMCTSAYRLLMDNPFHFRSTLCLLAFSSSNNNLLIMSLNRR